MAMGHITQREAKGRTTGPPLRCSVALGVKKRVLMRSVLTEERTAPIVCDVRVSNTSSETSSDATADLLSFAAFAFLA